MKNRKETIQIALSSIIVDNISVSNSVAQHYAT